MHGLIFETSIWLLAGSTRFLSKPWPWVGAQIHRPARKREEWGMCFPSLSQCPGPLPLATPSMTKTPDSQVQRTQTPTKSFRNGGSQILSSSPLDYHIPYKAPHRSVSEGKKSRWVGQALSSVTQSQFSDSHNPNWLTPRRQWLRAQINEDPEPPARRASGPSPWTRHLPDAGPRASPGSAEAQIQAQILRRGCDILPGQGWHIYSKRPVGGNFRPPCHPQKIFSNEDNWHF